MYSSSSVRLESNDARQVMQVTRTFRGFCTDSGGSMAATPQVEFLAWRWRLSTVEWWFQRIVGHWEVQVQQVKPHKFSQTMPRIDGFHGRKKKAFRITQLPLQMQLHAVGAGASSSTCKLAFRNSSGHSCCTSWYILLISYYRTCQVASRVPCWLHPARNCTCEPA